MTRPTRLKRGDVVFAKNDPKVMPSFVQGKRGTVKIIRRRSERMTKYFVEFPDALGPTDGWLMWREELRLAPRRRKA